MRNAFSREITALGCEDERVVMLSGDIGNRLFDDCKNRFPERFFNCGVAEANMISMAAGMALCGLRPVAYTITPFITARCIEQIKVDVCYYNLPVVIVGVGAGLSYAELGVTHLACEDISLLRAYPNMTVVCPADTAEVRLALRAALKLDGPVYIRLGKKNEPAVHEQEPDFIFGKGIVVRKGNDVCLLGTGNMVATAVEAAEKLAKRGISAEVVSLHTVKPLDETLLANAFSRFKAVVTVEEHFLRGGLGASVAEWLSDGPRRNARLLRIGIDDRFFTVAGKQADARRLFGLTPDAIAERTLRLLESDGC